jgi:hypothetical protein
MWRRE